MHRSRCRKKCFTILALAGLLFLCSRPAAAESTRLELYLPEDTENQEEEEDISAPGTFDEAGSEAVIFLAAAVSGSAGLAFLNQKRQKADS